MDKIYKRIISYIIKKYGRAFLLNEICEYYDKNEEFISHNEVMRLNILMTEIYLTSNLLYKYRKDYDKLNSIKDALDSSFYIAIKRMNSDDE